MSTTYVPPHKRSQQNSTSRPLPPTSSSKLDRLQTLGSPDDGPKRTNTMASRLAAIKTTEAHIETWVQPKKEKDKQKSPLIAECREDDEGEGEESSPLSPTDDGWTVVEKKAKLKRDRIQEALDNGDAPLSDEDEEQSFWDEQPEEYETYWDRKP